jgi:hypothetical protein
MEEKLKDILEYYEENIERYETDVANIIAKMRFCKDHDFDEEYRIANVKYQALNMCVYRWREMYTDIENLINEQQS